MTKKPPKTYGELEKFFQEELESITLCRENSDEHGDDTEWDRGYYAGYFNVVNLALNLVKEINAARKTGKKWGYSFSTEGYRMQDADIQHRKFGLTYAELLEAQKQFGKNPDWKVFYLPDKKELK